MHSLCLKPEQVKCLHKPSVTPQNSHNLVVFDTGITERMPNKNTNLHFLIFSIVGLIAITSFGTVEGEMQRDVVITSIHTIKEGDKFNHAFAVCSSDIVKDDLILVLSDSAFYPIKIEDDKKMNSCTAFNAKILAIDPSTIKAEMIKIENKNKTIQTLESKINSLNNIIKREFIEHDNIKIDSMEFQVEQKLVNQLSRISDLIEYKTRSEKKLEVILSI